MITGRDHKYGFGGKEYQDELGLDWYDVSARNYDPALGRWMNLDPLAEQMRRHSPYNFGFDNPIYYIDPDGMAPQASDNIIIRYEDVNGDTQEVEYRDGEAVNEDGCNIGESNEYVGKVVGDLNVLNDSGDAELADRLDTMENSDNEHVITNTDNPGQDGQNLVEDPSKEVNHEPTGSTTQYNPDKNTNRFGEDAPAKGTLAHEFLGHGYDADTGTTDFSNVKVTTPSGNSGYIPKYEVNAVNVQNRAGAKLGDKKRTTYRGGTIPSNLLLDTHKKK